MAWARWYVGMPSDLMSTMSTSLTGMDMSSFTPSFQVTRPEVSSGARRRMTNGVPFASSSATRSLGASRNGDQRPWTPGLMFFAICSLRSSSMASAVRKHGYTLPWRSKSMA
jgi:hypothetical protein